MTTSPSDVYLHDIPFDKAWDAFITALTSAGRWEPFPAESVPLEQALGRVTAAPIWARLSSPHYHAAAMDGYAIAAVDTVGASDRTPVTLSGEQIMYVDTGDPMPSWANAVIPIELVEALGSSARRQDVDGIRIRKAVVPWSHVRPMGEDMVASELVLPSGHTLRPVDLGAIAGCGHASVHVHRKPQVAIIPTGTELVPAGSEAKAGDIIEYNSLVLAAQVEEWGGEATRWPIINDDVEEITKAVREAAQTHDLVLTNAGSSAGSEDYSASVISSLGTLIAHGIAIRPGHPVILGTLARGEERIPAIGVPGYPVSAALTGRLFVRPLLDRWLGRVHTQPDILPAVLTQKVHSTLGDDEYLRVTLGRVGGQLVAAPLSRGAGVITSLVRADGIVLIPAGVQGVQAGEVVQVRLLRKRAVIEKTLLMLGSHDLTIDVMAQFLGKKGTRLTSANLGSLGGLIALRKGEAHLAGSHLLDAESGEYNLSYIREYLPETPVVVVSLVHREQGLMVAPGNPHQIAGLADLVNGIRYINRQRGAGTRVLLDYHLGLQGIEPSAIQGYDREEYTHLAVAAAVASDRADCGLGIHAAARALNLDFIPLYQERYDLIIPLETYHSEKIQPLLALLQEPDFKQAIEALPGYDTRSMGRLVAHIP